MPAIAKFEPGARDSQLAISSHIDAVGAAEAPIASPQMLESRAVDTDLAYGVVCGQDALFAVTDKTVRYLQTASLQANACGIGVRYTHVLKDAAAHRSREGTQDPRGRALARRT